MPILRHTGVLLAAAFLVSGPIASAQLFLCQHDQVVRSRCCCPSTEETPPPAPQMRAAAGCCEIFTVEAESQPSVAPRAGQPASMPALASRAAPMVEAYAARRVPARAAGGDLGPPIILATRSLLL